MIASSANGWRILPVGTCPSPQVYKDIRKLLEDKSIDAISIATPNHWHSLMGIWACQAGKDAYVEKPCSHCWWEGHQLVAAARKYDRIVMHGTQGRSAEGYIEGVRKLREGVIGDVYLSRGLCYKWRDTIGMAKVEPVPDGVDYDLWTGPAPLKPFTKQPLSLQLALDLGYGQRRCGQSRRA